MMYSGHQPPPPNYVMLANQYGAPPPPGYYQPHPHHRHMPRCEGHRSSNCCMRCICCCYCFLFMLIFSAAITLVLLYTFFKPKIPIYKLEDFNVNAFNVQPDMTVTSDFLVTVRAENPNTRIGFIYGEGSLVTISFEDSVLCRGKLPVFHQGHDNVTLVKVPLTGRSPFGSGLHEAFMNGERQGKIPLLIQVKVPISVVLDAIPLRQFVFHVDCHLTVDNLKPDKQPRILSTTYTFGLGNRDIF